MDSQNLSSIVRNEINKNEFCISQCVKVFTTNVNERDVECLERCAKTYEQAFKLVVNYENEKFKN